MTRKIGKEDFGEMGNVLFNLSLLKLIVFGIFFIPMGIQYGLDVFVLASLYAMLAFSIEIHHSFFILLPQGKLMEEKELDSEFKSFVRKYYLPIPGKKKILDWMGKFMKPFDDKAVVQEKKETPTRKVTTTAKTNEKLKEAVVQGKKETSTRKVITTAKTNEKSTKTDGKTAQLREKSQKAKENDHQKHPQSHGTSSFIEFTSGSTSNNNIHPMDMLEEKLLEAEVMEDSNKNRFDVTGAAEDYQVQKPTENKDLTLFPEKIKLLNIEDIAQFRKNIKMRSKGEDEYKRFLDLVKKCNKEVSKFFHDHHELLKEFTDLLPDSSAAAHNDNPLHHEKKAIGPDVLELALKEVTAENQKLELELLRMKQSLEAADASLKSYGGIISDCQMIQREWWRERDQLLEQISTANKEADLYKRLLHNL